MSDIETTIGCYNDYFECVCKGNFKLQCGAYFSKVHVMDVIQALNVLVDITVPHDPSDPLQYDELKQNLARQALGLIIDENTDEWPRFLDEGIQQQVNRLLAESNAPTGHTLKIANDVLQGDPKTGFSLNLEHITKQIEEVAESNDRGVDLSSFPGSISFQNT